MSLLFFLYLLSGLILLGMLILKRKELFIVILFPFLLASIYLSDILIFGKPVEEEMFFIQPSFAEAEILGVKMVRGQAIYLLLDVKTQKEPIYVKYKWDQKFAEKLQKLLNDAREGTNTMIIKNPYDLNELDQIFELRGLHLPNK